MLKKIGDTLFGVEYSYIEYLSHIVSDCVDAQVVEGGCPLDKCKLKHSVGLKELRSHLNDECTKVDMQCSNCKEKIRRPFIKFHDCSDTYEGRLKTEKDKLFDAQRKIEEYENLMKRKEEENLRYI